MIKYSQTPAAFTPKYGKNKQTESQIDFADVPAEGRRVSVGLPGRGGVLAVEGERGGVHEAGAGDRAACPLILIPYY